MSKNLPYNTPNTLSLPKSIGSLTLNDLMNHPNTDVIKKGNKISMRHRSDQGIAAFEFTSYKTGRDELKISSIPHRERKKDYLEDILTMKQNGMRQKDIAFELDISESYVSMILRKYRH